MFSSTELEDSSDLFNTRPLLFLLIVRDVMMQEPKRVISMLEQLSDFVFI